ncbi:MAG: amino acid adenylation domain-containing protein [Ardenticatenaceae bacterium]
MVFLLPQAVDRAAERFPEREAVRFSSVSSRSGSGASRNQSLSYAQLAERSNRLARVLVEEGVKRGDRVGIYMNKSLESVVAIYGIMKAGAAYVPLDPSAPLSRLGYVIRDCGIRHLITHKRKADRVGEMLAQGAALECVIGLPPKALPRPQDLPIRTISWQEVYQTPGHRLVDVAASRGTIEQDLAYILYTSGSTGDPKGIMHTHRSGLSFAQWAAQTYSLDHHDRVSNHAPLHFDLSTFDFFAAALAGATTVIIPEEYKMLPASLSKLMADEKMTVWYSVPFALTQLLLRGALQDRDLSALRWILFAGEPFATKYLRQLMRQLPHARFSNLYGPTETNVCTYYHVPPLSDGGAHDSKSNKLLADTPIPIGKVCANAEALVLRGGADKVGAIPCGCPDQACGCPDQACDCPDQPAAPGEEGELLIRGPLLMRGYWGRPDLNERAFLRRAVFGQYEDLFYRTGDLVQLLPDGNFKFLGRKDRQIKIRGHRVELDEIEVALQSHQQVQEAAVYPVPDGQTSQQIEAVVTLKQAPTSKCGDTSAQIGVGEALSSADLRRHISKQLPWYAIPTKIAIVEELPRTSTDKINRRELQAQASATPG